MNFRNKSTLRYFVICNCFLLLISLGSEQESKARAFTLNEALGRGKAENSALQGKEIEVDEAREEIRKAWGAFSPSLKLNYSNKKLDNNSNDEQNTDYLSQKHTQSSVSLIQPLFTGFAGTAELKKAKLLREYKEQDRLLTWLKLSREIRRDFTAVLFGHEMEKLWSESIERLNYQKNIYKAWYDLQLINKVQLLEVDVEISNAILQQQEVNSQLSAANARLIHSLSLPPDIKLEVVGSLNAEIDFSFGDLEQCLLRAMNSRPEFKMANLDLAMTQQDIKSIAALNLPHAALELSWIDIEEDYKNESVPDAERDYYSVGLNVSMDLFNGGRNIFSYRQKKLTVERLKLRKIDIKQTIETEVRTYFSQLKSSSARYSAAKDALRHAKAAWELAQQSLDLGIGSQKDLLDSELKYTQAEINLLNARLNRQIRYADLIYALGETE